MASQLQLNHLEELKSEGKQVKQKGWIEADVADWLIPEEPAPDRLYGLLKDHSNPSKWSEESKIPPLSLVESVFVFTFENASNFV